MPTPDPSAVAAIDQAVRTRRSVRDFAPGPIDEAEVLRVLELAAIAPSGWNLQPWRFLVVTDPVRKKALRAAAYDQRQVEAAPLVIVLTTDMVDTLARVDEVKHPAMPDAAFATVRGNILGAFSQKSPADRDAWGVTQGNILLGYLLLLLEVHGYRTSPMLGFDPAKVRALFDLPDHTQIPALVAVGQPASTEQQPPPHRHDFGSLVRRVDG